MESKVKFDEWENSKYGFCRVLVWGAIIYFGFSVVMTLVNVVYLGLQPSSAIKIIDTGYSYRFDLVIGYAQCTYENLPVNVDMTGPKIFSVTFLIMVTLVKDIPYLIALNYARKILNTMKRAHSPFVPELADYMGKIGEILILLGLFSKLVLQVLMGAIAYHTLNFVNPTQFSWVFSGIVVLLISDIFRRGCELQEFSDETL